MIKKYPQEITWSDLRLWLEERANPQSSVDSKVAEILAQVKLHGDEALSKYTAQFDCPDFTCDMLNVSHKAIAEAKHEIPSTDLDILKESIANVRAFHEKQKENSWFSTSADGTVLGQMVTPVARVGLYVPGGQGGTTPLISSLIMNAVPAQVAGVPEIIVSSPPRKDGTLNPYLLATAELLNITTIFASGSAWAIAALAYGTERIPACHLIAGPGNIFVATAKAQLIGQVGIDMIAGPSEIAILADASAHPAWLAADMLSQAEHDPLAAALLITTDALIAKQVAKELERQTASLPRSDIAKASLQNWGAILLVKDMQAGIELINKFAPEHLELAVAEPWTLLGQIRHAGAIFMGDSSPEPVGDYFAGPNHVLPTLRTARFSSALSVNNFCKRSSIIATSGEYLAKHGAKIARMARLEGLEAHARSVEIRSAKE